MTRLHATYRPHAFTLVELLIGITISVLIIGAATTSYLAAVQSWDKSRTRTTTFQHARVAFDMIERSVHAALPPNSEANIAFEGESGIIEDTELSADTIRMTSTGGLFDPARTGTSDLNEVSFFIDVDKDTGEPSLMMRQRKMAGLDVEEYPGVVEELAPRVVSFDVWYYDGIEFVEEWTSNQLPEAVRVTLLLYDFDAEEDPVWFQKIITPRLVGSE